jgi:hypothetical protein
MPNWCSNNLSIYGKKEDMKPFMEKIKNEDGSYSLLENLYPTPEELLIGDVSASVDEQQKANLEKLGYKSWYDWRIAHWGVKWPESDLSEGQEYTEYDSGNAVIAFNFESPWCSPLEAFDKISADYPNLLFCIYYEEPGMCFCGKVVWGNGERQESYESELIQNYFDEEYLYEQYVSNQ